MMAIVNNFFFGILKLLGELILRVLITRIYFYIYVCKLMLTRLGLLFCDMYIY